MTTSLNVKEQRYYILFSIVSGTLKPGAPLAPLKPGAPLAQLLFYPPYRVCITSGWKDPPLFPVCGSPKPGCRLEHSRHIGGDQSGCFSSRVWLTSRAPTRPWRTSCEIG